MHYNMSRELRRLGIRTLGCLGFWVWGGGGGGGGGVPKARAGRTPALVINFSPPLRIRPQIASVPPSRHSSLKLSNRHVSGVRLHCIGAPAAPYLAPSAPHC